MISDAQTAALRSQLVERRGLLETALQSQPEAAEVLRLLREVDAAMERMDQGTFGICEVCHDSIERDRLMADPLIRLCIDHLTADQRRELEDDLGLAQKIQAALLPNRVFTACGWEAYYHYEPAGVVSGDFCDLAAAPGGLFFLSGDVSGKGVAAALLMSHLHATCRTLLSMDASLPRFVELANRLFCESTMSSHYATLVCGRADVSGEIEICNAGHCPPILVRKNGSETVPAAGLPIGLFANARFTSQRMRLGPEDALFVYTDGLTEACNPDGGEYGEQRAIETVSRLHGRPAREIVDTALTDASNFLAGARRPDDLTLLAIRRL
jgi:sigma-B regulation protein RsbU (phosphoserine phosphatase)